MNRAEAGLISHCVGVCVYVLFSYLCIYFKSDLSDTYFVCSKNQSVVVYAVLAESVSGLLGAPRALTSSTESLSSQQQQQHIVRSQQVRVNILC